MFYEFKKNNYCGNSELLTGPNKPGITSTDFEGKIFED